MPKTVDLLIKYFQGPQWLILFGVVLIYTLIRVKKPFGRALILGIGLFFVCVYNDFIYSMSSRFVEPGVYYRFIWILPITIWIACGLTGMFFDIKSVWLRTGFAAAVLLCMLFMDHTWLERDRATLSRPENEYLLPDEVLAVSEALESEHPYGEKIRCLIPMGLTMQLRCADASVECVVPRRDYLTMAGQSDKKYKQRKLAYMIEKNEKPKAESLKKLLDDSETDYIVAFAEYDQGSLFEAAGCQLIKKTGIYEVYKVR